MKFLQRSILIFSIALCGSVFAQTTVCSGDSVVLMLNGYQHGSTVWEQSPDRTNWFSAQGTPYKDSLVITATNTFYYRAKVIEGACDPFYSDTVQVTVRPTPPPPVAMDATGVNLFSFQANWTASAGTTTYYLDVATDAGFTSFVVGYNNRKVDNSITCSVTEVSCSATYYYRVRVYNDTCGASASSNTITVVTTSCPTECRVRSTCSGNITDSRDNKTYTTVQIGSQCWMAQNLNIGKMIPGTSTQTQVDSFGANTVEKYCYGDNVNNCITYGGLYAWGEMMAYGSSDSIAPGPQGICPTGWHIPTDSEWTCLEKTLGGAPVAGGKLKDTTGWIPEDTSATNSSGFSARPSGYRTYTGSFTYQGIQARIWTATEDPAITAGGDVWFHLYSYGMQGLYRFDSDKATSGFSVRCVKD